MFLSGLHGNDAEAQPAFGPPTYLNTNAVTDTGGDIDPAVATDGLGHWVVAWASTENLGGTAGTDFDIFVSRSSGFGTSWSAPALLNTNGDSDTGDDVDVRIATDGIGNWAAVWKSNDSLGSTVGGDNDIFVSRSVNNGLTWSPPEALNSNAATDAGNDIDPVIATSGLGGWIAVWSSDEDLTNTPGMDPDILIAHSSDLGVTWSARALLNSNGTLDTDADREPELVTDGAGNWVAVWSSFRVSDQDIFAAHSINDGLSWSPPVLVNPEADTDTGHDFTPHVAADGSGNWLVVWPSAEDIGGTTGVDEDLFVSRSSDVGATWNTPVLLNSNGTADTGTDALPRIVVDAFGVWTVLWQSLSTLGGTIGNDWDILIANSNDNGATWTAPVLVGVVEPASDHEDSEVAVAMTGTDQWVAIWNFKTTISGSTGTDLDIAVAVAPDASLLPVSSRWTFLAMVSTFILLGIAEIRGLARRQA